MGDQNKLSRVRDIFAVVRSGKLFGAEVDLNSFSREEILALDEAVDLIDSLNAEQVEEFSSLASKDLSDLCAASLRRNTRLNSTRSNQDVINQVDYRLAETTEEKLAIYRMRYRAYLREGTIQPSESQMVSDHHDDAPNAWTFGVYVRDELYSSIRISVLTSAWRSSPSQEIFADLVNPELDRGKTIVEPTRFVADPDKARRFPELPYFTVRLGYVACEYFNADILLSYVRPEHRSFYRKVFLQEPIGEPRLLPGLTKPVGLLASNYCDTRDRIFQRFPFMRSSAFERRMLFGRSTEETEDLGGYSALNLGESAVDEPFPMLLA